MTTVAAWTTRIALPALLCVAATTSHAFTVLSNLPGVDGGVGVSLGLGIDGVDRSKGVGLTVGASALTFESVSALISNFDIDSTLSGGIYSSVGNNPGVQLAAFTPQLVPAVFTTGVLTLTTAAPFVLQASTAYWIVLDGPGTESNLGWNLLAPSVAPTASNGVSYSGYRFSSDGGATWGSSGTFNAVSVSAVPESSTLLMVVAGLGLTSLRLRRS